MDRDPHLSRLLQDIQDSLSELTRLDGENQSEPIAERLFKSEQESAKVPVNLNINGQIDIRVSFDEMTAWIDLSPPSGSGKLIEPSHAIEKLFRANVTSGVDFQRLEDLIFQCNTDRIELHDEVIARGIEAEDEIPEHVELVIKPSPVKAAESKGSPLRVDYKAINPFVIVKKGDLLARLAPRKAGVMGQGVTGSALPYSIKKVAELGPGENVVLDGDEFRAGCDGRFVLRSNVFSVNEILEITENVDYSTGNIWFPKDVIIRGRVEDGFTVHSGGMLFCEKTLDATKVTCQAELFVRGGILGKNKGTVRADGKIEVDFIENCHVESRAEILVKKSILNSFVYSKGAIVLGEAGRILGGRVCAAESVTAHQIGGLRTSKTEVICGIDYAVQQELLRFRDKSFEIVRLLTKIQNARKLHPENRALQNAYEKAQRAAAGSREKAAVLLTRLVTNENAQVTVTGRVFPGVSIEICNITYIVAREMKRVRFRLDKKSGNVIADRL